MWKAELHLHLEGAAKPALVERLARRHGVDVSRIIQDGEYVWHDFTSFLNAYDMAASVFRTAEDYTLLAYETFSGLAAQNCLYGEVFLSPSHAETVGLAYVDMVAAVAEGLDHARRETGIEGRFIPIIVRHLGPETAINVAELVVENPHPLVTGFGMAGDERAFEVEEFTEAFELAADAGLGLTAHAGEFLGPDSIRGVLDHLGVTRIGHGVRAVEDAGLMHQLARDGVVLEMCPGSNVALGVTKRWAEHRLPRFLDAGIPVTLNSDDPPFFHTTLTHEYEMAAEYLRMRPHDLTECTRTALEAAFVDEATRRKLLKRLEKPPV
ncbi:MAG: adenosine deaminase [Pseudomonadota bacterium]